LGCSCRPCFRRDLNCSRACVQNRAQIRPHSQSDVFAIPWRRPSARGQTVPRNCLVTGFFPPMDEKRVIELVIQFLHENRFEKAKAALELESYESKHVPCSVSICSQRDPRCRRGFSLDGARLDKGGLLRTYGGRITTPSLHPPCAASRAPNACLSMQCGTGSE
jgi:hypothetical protein